MNKATNDEIKSEIQHRLEKAEREISRYKEGVSERQNKIDSRSGTIDLLKKYGEYEKHHL